MASWLKRRTKFLLMSIIFLTSVFGQDVKEALEEDAGDAAEPEENASAKKKFKFGGYKDLLDPDDQNIYMPYELQCDGCRIMDITFYKALEKEVTKFQHRSPDVIEPELIELFEKACESDFFEYGYSVIDGKKRMKGPGLGNDDLPGVMQATGKWSIRLQNMCKQYAEELGEKEIYVAFMEAHQSGQRHKFFKFMCIDSGPLGFCRENIRMEL